MSEANGPGGDGPDRSRRSVEAGLSGRLRDLEARLAANRTRRGVDGAYEPPRRPGAALALRVGADFVAGVVLGVGIGWGFDWLFGTSPWGLVVFLLLGFAAGLLSVLRTAGLLAGKPGLDDEPGTRRPD